MASPNPPPNEDFFSVLIASIKSWPENLNLQLNSIAKDSKNARTWINIAIILGGYMLLRPLIIKFFNSTQTKTAEGKAVMQAGMTKGYGDWDDALVSANALRGKKGGFGGEEGVRKREKAREKRGGVGERGEEVGVEGLLDQLVDYEEGEDGW